MRDFMHLMGGNKDVQAKAGVTANWLGLFGALIATFFINTVIGYFSIAVPVLLMIWGWFILRRHDLKALAYYTNYSLFFAFLLATLAGVVRLISWMPELSPSWSGTIGDFFANVICRLIGTTGAFIAILTVILIIAVIVVDYNVHSTLSMMKRVFLWFRSLSEHKKQSAALAYHGGVAETEIDSRDFPAATIVGAAAAQVPTRGRLSKSALPPAAPLPEAPKRMPVSIDRGEPFPPPTPQPVPPIIIRNDEGPLRSNGVIPKESIDGFPSFTSGNGAAVKNGEPATEAQPEKKQEQKSTERRAAKTIESDDSPILHDANKAAAQTEEIMIPQAPEIPQDTEESNSLIASEKIRYTPPSALLLDIREQVHTISDAELEMKAALVKEKLAVFGIEIIKRINVKPGPVVTMFEIVPDSSVKISRIVSLADDLALALAARGIRIIAPIPGKSAVGIEIPNNEPELVNLASVVVSDAFQKSKQNLCLGLGKGITGEVVCDDLAKMPHLLIAGATGSGKSVGINVMINSLLFKMHPSDVKFVMIDPKKIELMQYRGLNKHFLAISPDLNEEIITDPQNAVLVLKSLELEMDMRYTKLAKAGVRHITDYNAKLKAGLLKNTDMVRHYHLPYIVVIIDELADLMITAAGEVEEPIARLAQLARAIGIHLLVATQRPSVDVITGVIKANFSARIAYQVASKIDSRTILDATGADQLLGNGDMLYLASGHPKSMRIQNAYISTVEIERVIEHIQKQIGFARPYLLPSMRVSKRNQSREDSIGFDEFLEEAARLIVRHQQGSVSLLQRRLKIGYSRAARIVDQLEQAGIVGSYDGSKAREVLVDDEAELDVMLQDLL